MKRLVVHPAKCVGLGEPDIGRLARLGGQALKRSIRVRLVTHGVGQQSKAVIACFTGRELRVRRGLLRRLPPDQSAGP